MYLFVCLFNSSRENKALKINKRGKSLRQHQVQDVHPRVLNFDRDLTGHRSPINPSGYSKKRTCNGLSGTQASIPVVLL